MWNTITSALRSSKTRIGFVALALFWGSSAYAAQFETFGDYAVHYNAINTEMLQPDIAKQYKISRSKNRAFLNISVRKKGAGDIKQDSAVNALVSASATNLNGQLQNIDMREVHEGTAIYYIGEFRISNAETLDFQVEVNPERQGQNHQIKFRQEFFID